MTGRQHVLLYSLLLVASCGGSKAAGPASPEADDADTPAAQDEAVSPEADADGEPAASNATEEASEASADAEPAEEAPVEEAEAEAQTPSEDEGPSDDLQSYVGGGAYTPEYRTVTDNMDSIKQCYLDAIRVDPDISGMLKVRFTVNKAGKVTKAKAVVNELNDQVQKCVLGTIKKIKFPKRKDNRTVEYPFKFTPAP